MRQRLLYKEVPAGQERQVGGFVFPRSIEQDTFGVEQYEAKKRVILTSKNFKVRELTLIEPGL